MHLNGKEVELGCIKLYYPVLEPRKNLCPSPWMLQPLQLWKDEFNIRACDTIKRGNLEFRHINSNPASTLYLKTIRADPLDIVKCWSQLLSWKSLPFVFVLLHPGDFLSINVAIHLSSLSSVMCLLIICHCNYENYQIYIPIFRSFPNFKNTFLIVL